MSQQTTSPAPCATADDGRVAPLLPVTGGGVPVPVVDGRTVPYANLDYAASAPSLEAVTARVAEVLPWYASVHRGAGYASQVSTALYEQSRAQVGEFVGARQDDVVVLVRNTTDALNLLASAVPSGGEVLFLDVEHHANLLPWAGRAHRCVEAAPSLAQTLADVEAALAERPVALLAVTGCSNVTGELLPVAELTRLAHAHGARIAADAAQLAPHRAISLRDSGIDYVAFSGHKLYAPFGSGALVGRRDWLDDAPAYLAGGGAVRAVRVDGVEWAAAPARHEGGTPNVLGAVALAQACASIAALPNGALEAHETTLAQRLTEGLATLEGVEVLSIWSDSTERAGVVGFTVAGHDPGRVAAYLSAEHGIGVRDGKFCAHPLLSRLGHGDGALRASLGLGSTSDDVDRLVGALEQLLLRGEQWDYALVEGRWAPSPDPRPAADVLRGVVPGPAGASPCIG